MSYYSGQDHDLEASGRAIAKYIHDDPLKVTELAEHAAQLLTSGLIQQSNNVVSSVLASVVSAASERLLQCPVSETYILSRTLPEAWFKDAHAALIVGFGGFLGTVCRFSHVRWVHVIDLKYENRRHEIDSYMASFKNQYPDRRFTVSTHIDIHRYMQDFDLVCVTGSTLCNDTLEPFLENKASGSRLLLQGQSASVYPALLFLHGVDGIATTLKPQILSDLARGCYSGDRLRPYLEGKLPWMYLSHRSGKSRNAGAFGNPSAYPKIRSHLWRLGSMYDRGSTSLGCAL